jgi:hypothetical protein
MSFADLNLHMCNGIDLSYLPFEYKNARPLPTGTSKNHCDQSSFFL